MTGRHELKFICSPGELAVIEEKLSRIARKDPHAGEQGTYTITSLYFDDMNDSCLNDNEAGAIRRYKFRARYYGTDASSLRLEKKVKTFDLGTKYSCPITADQLERFFTGDTQELLYDTPPLLRELALRSQTRLMAPKIIVRYERTPFIYENGNVRITLDRAISAGRELDRFLTGDFIPCLVQPAGEELLEVKYDALLPGELKSLIEFDRLTQTSFSKYYLCRTSFGQKGY